MSDESSRMAAARIASCLTSVRAMRVLRWCHEWPVGHSERPHAPAWVREWERVHGPAPESAERVVGKEEPKQ